MKLLHNNEVELSRTLLASIPEGVEAIDGDGGYTVSAYPSVVIDVPEYTYTCPAYDEAGNLAGVVSVAVAAHEEVLRSPASWDAVAQIVDFVAARAAASPVEG